MFATVNIYPATCRGSSSLSVDWGELITAKSDHVRLIDKSLTPGYNSFLSVGKKIFGGPEVLMLIWLSEQFCLSSSIQVSTWTEMVR